MRNVSNKLFSRVSKRLTLVAPYSATTRHTVGFRWPRIEKCRSELCVIDYGESM